MIERNEQIAIKIWEIWKQVKARAEEHMYVDKVIGLRAHVWRQVSNQVRNQIRRQLRLDIQRKTSRIKT